MSWEHMREDANCQGNAGECRGMQGERTIVGATCQGNAGESGECRGVAGKCMGVCKVPGECRGIYGSGCKVLGGFS